MEYLHRKELQSDPVVEPTAVTMKSIKELLAEDEARLEQEARALAEKEAAAKQTPPATEAPAEPAQTPAKTEGQPAEPVVPRRPALQHPPTAEVIADARAKASALPRLNPDDETPRPSLLSRLFGRD